MGFFLPARNRGTRSLGMIEGGGRSLLGTAKRLLLRGIGNEWNGRGRRRGNLRPIRPRRGNRSFRSSVQFLSQTNQCTGDLRTEPPHEAEILNERYTPKYKCRDEESCCDVVQDSVSNPVGILRL